MKTMQRSPDIEGVFHLYATEVSSRNRPALSGYRPAQKIHENYFTTGEHKYLDVVELVPGSSALVEVWFITPEAYPRCLWKGREITVHEGERAVGALKVVRIFSEILLGDPASFSQKWKSPTGLE
jgi:translation elongation factor EF-Tu-like GTPase